MIRWARPATSAAERARRVRFARWMEIYWAEAQAWWQAAEYETMMYGPELAEYKTHNPRPTFKKYLLATAGQPR